MWRIKGTLDRADGRFYYIFVNDITKEKRYVWDWTFWRGYSGVVIDPGRYYPLVR